MPLLQASLPELALRNSWVWPYFVTAAQCQTSAFFFGHRVCVRVCVGGADDHSGATQAPQRTLAFRLVRQVITEMGGRRPKQREVRWEGNQEPEQQFPHRKAGGPGPCSWRGEPGPHPLLSSPPPPGRPQSRRGKHWGENRGAGLMVLFCHVLPL